jgi:hypothetical protein
MPTVNIYNSNKNLQQPLKNITHELRELIAGELTSDKRKLIADEITVRFLSVDGEAMIAPIEVEIKAYAYPDRIERSDQICLLVRKFMLDRIRDAKDIRVWLVLAELGHSWQD